MLYKGLNYLFGKKPEKETSQRLGKNYYPALQAWQAAQSRQLMKPVQPEGTVEPTETISR